MNFTDPKYSSFDDIEEMSFVKEFTKWFRGLDVKNALQQGEK